MRQVVENLEYALDVIKNNRVDHYETANDIGRLRSLSGDLKHVVKYMIMENKFTPLGNQKQIVTIEEFIKGENFLNMPEFRFIDPKFRFFSFKDPRVRSVGPIDIYTLFQKKDNGYLSVYAMSTTAAVYAILYKIYELSNLDIQNDLGIVSKPIVGIFAKSNRLLELSYRLIVDKLKSSNCFKGKVICSSRSRIDINNDFSIIFLSNVTSSLGLNIISGWVHGNHDHNEPMTELNKRIISRFGLYKKFSSLMITSD